MASRAAPRVLVKDAAGFIGSHLANLRALRADADLSGRVYNIGCGTAPPVMSLYEFIAEQLGPVPPPVLSHARRGDARSSLADLSAARSELGYQSLINLKAGLVQTLAWYKDHLS